MRRLHKAVAGGGALVVAGGVAVWLLSGPPKLGLEHPRIVIAAGEARVDEARARPAQILGTGATVHTGRGSVCFSVRASRACAGANAEVRLAELGPTSATLEVKRGTLVVSSAGDDLRLTYPSGTIGVKSATVAVEVEGGVGGPVVRALDGSAQLEPTGAPPLTVAAPDAVGMKDGKKRPPAATIEREERDVVKLAGRWQGSAGAVISVEEAHGRVEVDGAEVGIAPAGLLLDEGKHTLVIREGLREVSREALDLKAGQKVVRGG
jgi:hypothetical protein